MSAEPANTDIQAAWYRCPGKELESELVGLGRSARTFLVNSQELIGAAEGFENVIVQPLLLRSRRRELREFASEIVRLFQNAITSGHSFFEHCDRFVSRRYKGKQFKREFDTYYQEHVERSGVCMFVRELRGFILHSESMSPVFTRRVVDFSDPFDSTHAITLNADALHQEKARWSRTTGPVAREYLDRLGTSINIRRLIHEYRAAVKQFGDWLLARVREIDSEILAECRVLHDELLSLLPPALANELHAAAPSHALNSWFEGP